MTKKQKKNKKMQPVLSVSYSMNKANFMKMKHDKIGLAMSIKHALSIREESPKKRKFLHRASVTNDYSDKFIL